MEGNPVNMLDPIRKRFGYSQLGLVRIYASRIHFSFVFPKKAQIILRKTNQDPGWMAWPGRSLVKHIWSGSKLGYRTHWPLFLAGHNWPATSSPLSDLVPYFHRRPG